MVYSSSMRFGHPEVFLGKQLAAFLIGVLLFLLLSTLNYQIFSQYPKSLFLISVSFLIIVLFAGTVHRGARAWFELGPLSFQPSEISKLLVILILAGLCDKNAKEMKHLKSLVVPFAVVLFHITLILLQPDFGSTLVYFPILLGILFIAGVRLFYLYVISFYGLVCATIVLVHTYLSVSPDFLEIHPIWNYLYKGMSLGKEFFILQMLFGVAFLLVWWFLKELRVRIPIIYFLCTFLLIAFGWFSSSIMANSIKDYQRKRLIVFFNPAIDSFGSGYHVIQSMIALGSGKIFGKGLFSGTQGRLGFLPEQHTDFIFSVLGEELGFVVSGFVVLLYFILIWRCIAIASGSRDRFGSLVAVGIGSMFAFYIILNLMMVMGLAPVTGLPLPFLSYGGSSLVSSLAAVGILSSIYIRRYTH